VNKVVTGTINEVGLTERKMYREGRQCVYLKRPEICRCCLQPRCTLLSCGITDVKGGKVSNMLSRHTETNSYTSVSFVFENVNKK
jgi:hypothetical protein